MKNISELNLNEAFHDRASQSAYAPIFADQSLDHLCAMAATLLKGRLGVLLLRTSRFLRVIAETGAKPGFRSCREIPTNLRFQDDAQLFVDLPSNKPDVIATLEFLEQKNADWLFITPIIRQEHGTVFLIVAGEGARPKLTSDMKVLLGELKTVIAEGFKVFERHLINPTQAGIATSLPAIEFLVTQSSGRALLLDDELKIRAISKDMADAFGQPQQDMIGVRRSDLALPMSDAIDAILHRTLETKISPPNCEIVDIVKHQVFSLTVSPVNPLHSNRTYLLVGSTETTDYCQRKRQLSIAIETEKPDDPAMAFLKETLVPRRAIRSRNSVSYLTLRSWRTPIRKWQIKAVKALKANIPPEMPDDIADEMIVEISSLVGSSAFRAVVPIPCSNSAPNSCLSVEIARAVAAKLDIPVIHAFVCRQNTGASHPKKNKCRDPMLLTNPVDVPVILVDDVATSGAHIEEALIALRQQAASVLAIAWIGGDAT